MLKYDPMRDYYRLLRVADDAPATEIKTAFRSLMREAHPDVNGGKPESKQWAQDLNEAYEALSQSRAEYDRLKSQYALNAAMRRSAPRAPARRPVSATTGLGGIFAGIAIGLAAIGLGVAFATAFSDDERKR